ncbi:LytTR family DNA-binding domain-containing protein [uncultured Shimia sp.]|uniref:LytTR family DNA-binding domain-containing protein n=1 Tax=uncultured Shimia sp. TaxID=573152 RepID=UPI00261DB4BA|nr:LytTR family DNA-binding domain-containing protein [uncultured Shimia sp.]
MTKVANDSIFAETCHEVYALACQRWVWFGLFGVGLLIGLTGPFGTFDSMTLLERSAYWLIIVGTTFWIGYAVSFATATLAERIGIGNTFSLAIGATVASAPVAAWLAGFHSLTGSAQFWDELFRLFPFVGVISVIVAVLSEHLGPNDVTPVKELDHKSTPSWLEQLPGYLGRDLILLQAQDHYVKAETKLGETLIRTGLQDASDALGDYGLRVHRSWWVSRGAIKALRSRGGGSVVVLQDGRELPIGRTYRRAVRTALIQTVPN